MPSLTRSFDTLLEAENAKSSYSPVQYSTGPIVRDPQTNKFTFTVTVWSLD